MKTKTELYTKDEPNKIGLSVKIWIVIAAVLGVLGAAACVAVCLITRQSNINRMYMTAVIVSVAVGWIIISIAHFRIDELRYKKQHVKAILEGEREKVDGSFSFTGERIMIKKGVNMFTVEARTGTGTKTVYLFEDKKARFPIDKAVSIDTVHGFIAAYEEGETA